MTSARKPALAALTAVAATLAAYTLLFGVQRTLFIAVYAPMIGARFTEFLAAMGHGLAMDLSMAAYLTAVPALTVIAAVCGAGRAASAILRSYSWIAATLLSLIFIADTVLYSYWDFRLDMTPLFYFFSSPKAAMASAPWWQAALAAVGVVVVTALIGIFLSAVYRFAPLPPHGKAGAIAVATVAAAALFIPIRGGFGVSTMNLSRAYFSANQRLNHAAVNPAFSLLYSLSHQNNFSEQFRFFADDEAARIVSESRSADIPSDNVGLNLAAPRPDIYIIILESFSSHVVGSLGGETIAVGLDSIAASGASWQRFYACSFRTDRGLTSILSGFPAQPTTSVMKSVERAENLPSIARELRKAGYATRYYYGGDANFTNMMAYLVAGGYDRVVSDRDFPISERRGKWGAHDHIVAERMHAELPTGSDAPRLTVFQTSSSHEPFEVPFSNPRFAGNPRANSIAYTDSVVTATVNAINGRQRPSLVVIVPDHYGTWPMRESLPDLVDRHHSLLIMTGTALRGVPCAPTTVASQIDIAPTLMELLDLSADAFPYGVSLIDPSATHTAWITEPEEVALVGPDGRKATFNVGSETIEPGSDPKLAKWLKARLQQLYTDLDKLRRNDRNP